MSDFARAVEAAIVSTSRLQSALLSLQQIDVPTLRAVAIMADGTAAAATIAKRLADILEALGRELNQGAKEDDV